MLEVKGEPGAVNSTLRWESTNKLVGNGLMTRVENLADKGFVNRMQRDGAEGETRETWNMEPDAEGTHINWSIEGEIGNKPWDKYMALMLENQMVEMMDAGLKNLKTEIEKNDKTLRLSTSADMIGKINGFEAVMKLSSPVKAIGIWMQTGNTPQEIDKAMDSAYSQLHGYAAKNGARPQGVPFAIYEEWIGKVTKLFIALPLDKAIPSYGDMKYTEIPARKVMAVTHTGSYDGLPLTYEAAYNYLHNNSVTPADYPVEFYLVSPATEKDSARWVTELQIPVK